MTLWFYIPPGVMCKTTRVELGKIGVIYWVYYGVGMFPGTLRDVLIMSIFVGTRRLVSLRDALMDIGCGF